MEIVVLKVIKRNLCSKYKLLFKFGEVAGLTFRTLPKNELPGEYITIVFDRTARIFILQNIF